MGTELKSQAMSTQMRDWLKGYFDGLYAAAGHLHTDVYSPISHNHNGIYATEGHSHAAYSAWGHTHQATQVLYHHLNQVTVAAGATQYITLSIPGLTALNGIVWPVAGTFSNMAMRINSTQPASGSLVITVMLNLVDTVLVTIVPAGSGAGSNHYSTQSTMLAAGSLLTIKVKNYATATSAQLTSWSMQFQAYTTA